MNASAKGARSEPKANEVHQASAASPASQGRAGRAARRSRAKIDEAGARSEPKANEVYDGVIAALPMAASLTLILSRLLPVHFEYRPNDLGIVSWTTERQYPLQQETFWAIFAVATSALLVWLLARALRRSRAPAASIVAIEALGAASLLALLWLPLAFAAPLSILAAAGAVWKARRSGSAEARSPAAEPPPAAFPERSAFPSALWAVGLGLLALALTPKIPLTLWNLVHSIPDSRRAIDHFSFYGELGQHLAWGNALLHGGLHGKDFFCLYGPLYDIGGVAFWAMLGRSIDAWELYVLVMRALALAGLMLLGCGLLRRRIWVLAIPFLVPSVPARLGAALFGLLFLCWWLRSGKLRWSLIAGLTGGGALLYSQEFGAVLCVTAAVAFALRRDLRAAGAFALGFVAAVTPVLVYYAANGALAPMLHDLAAFPGYMLAGYGKRPFPALLPGLPLAPPWSAADSAAPMRLAHGIPVVYVAGLLLALPISRLDPRRPLASLLGVLAGLRRDPWRTSILLTSLFGLLCFRVALGRSDTSHILTTLPPAALLVVVALEQLLGSVRPEKRARWLVLWRVGALGIFVLHAGFAEFAKPIRRLERSAEHVAKLVREGNHPSGSRELNRVTRWIQRRTQPGDPVLFLPNNAAYYYLTDRPNPIRFVMGHQIVTQAHRDEVLADLQANPPRFIVWDEGALRIDSLSDELVFGSELLRWIEESYQQEARLGSVEILSPRRPRERDDR